MRGFQGGIYYYLSRLLRLLVAVLEPLGAAVPKGPYGRAPALWLKQCDNSDCGKPWQTEKLSYWPY